MSGTVSVAWNSKDRVPPPGELVFCKPDDKMGFVVGYVADLDTYSLGIEVQMVGLGDDGHDEFRQLWPGDFFDVVDK